MPVGIAYRARLRDPALLPDLVEYARVRATVTGWVAADAPEQELAPARLRRLDGALERRERLSLSGLWVNPHFAADDLCLVFDRGEGELVDASRAGEGDADGGPVVNGFALARTTLADAGTHVRLVRFLEELAERDLASVEMGDPDGRELPRELPDVVARQRAARRELLRPARLRPEEPVRPASPLELLPPAETRRRNAGAPGGGPLARLPEVERGLLERSLEAFRARWGKEVRGLEEPASAVHALEALSELVLSHPEHRHDEEELERDFAWGAGVALGFALVALLGGEWEREEGAQGPRLRVANLGGVGLVWRPLLSARERLRQGPVFAHDAVLRWLQEMAAAAREELGDLVAP